jgi:trehalose 6-phosphate synthase/phosphatase
MSRLLIVSNRLPVSVERRKGKLHFKGSVGGVATGLGSYHESHESLWVGWADVPGRLDSLERDA